jgi:hypothetical protein
MEGKRMGWLYSSDQVQGWTELATYKDTVLLTNQCRYWDSPLHDVP